MRKVNRAKRRKIGVAVLGAAVFGLAVGANGASVNANDGAIPFGAAAVDAASRRETAARRGSANGGFWTRLGTDAVSTPDFDESNNFAGVANADGAKAEAAAQGRVESASFVGYAEGAGRESANGGRTRLVDWTAPDAASKTDGAAIENGNRPLDSASATVAEGSAEAFDENGRVGEAAKVGENSENSENSKNSKNSGNSGNGGNNKNSGDSKSGERSAIKGNGEFGEDGEDGESAPRSKTPILRDESVATTPSGGSLTGAVVSTFGALAVVLGAFFALVALLRRTGLKSGGGSALEIVDSTPVGDKARLLTIRWGNRLILAAKTPEKIAPLAEITDVDEANAMLAEIERRKETGAPGDVGARASAIWKRGRDAAKAWRTAFGTKGRR